ncbi:unnamed protein product, partial [Rodentolepis nana]|uniref:GatB_N domain-containing protein n=1 Tax=Rodentolepis nana TaxID=102285 RepID=A0A0R3TRY5_RODNA
MLKSSPILRNSIFHFSFSAFSCVPLIGLEIHAQLTSSRSKAFSPVQYAFAAPPNTQVHHFDAALPGSLPILNQNCFEWAIIAGLGLNCHINLISKFDRKHYFYADSPAGFQITQHDFPVAENGWLEYIWKAPELKSIPQVSKAKIRRIQLEQDTGKSLHDEKSSRSLIDLNRAGVALIEIVTDPVFTMSCQAAAFVDELASLLRHLRVCSSNMSTGEMRVDVNVSIGPSVSQQGPVVEIKNVNSLRAIRHAIDYEIHRQRKICQSGGKVINETRSFDVKTVSMRDKEVLQDYRFLPEPNLPPVR